MRVINYPYSKSKIYLCDKYHNKLAQFEITQGENTLEINRNNTFYKTTSGRVFYVYDGAGILQWQDTLKHYDFSTLDINVLDLYLCNGYVDSQNAQDISDFCEVYEKNIKANAMYLIPAHFDRIENQLLQGANHNATI